MGLKIPTLSSSWVHNIVQPQSFFLIKGKKKAWKIPWDKMTELNQFSVFKVQPQNTEIDILIYYPKFLLRKALHFLIEWNMTTFANKPRVVFRRCLEMTVS